MKNLFPLKDVCFANLRYDEMSNEDTKLEILSYMSCLKYLAIYLNVIKRLSNVLCR